MRKTLILFIYAFLLLPFYQAAAQRVQPVTWQVSLTPVAQAYKIGDRLTLSFTGIIAPGYHIYSVVPPKGEGNKPTTLDLDADAKGIKLSGPLTEAGKLEKKYDKVFETDVQYFEGRVTFRQSFQITHVGAILIGYLGYQVCDSGSCLPGNYNFKFPLLVIASEKEKDKAPGSDKIVPKTDTIPRDTTASQTKATVSNSPTPTVKDSLWVTFFKSLAFGFVALLTPCVYPMLPLTISYFTKQKRKGGALLYALSIVFIYVVLGLLITIAFGATALYNIASNPWVNLAFFGIILAFGLSFLGMFNLTLPTAWSNATDRQSERGGLIGIFFMALTLVVVSFSCTGPLVGTVLFDAAGGSYLAPSISMLGFALAFAIPFGLFALFPSWMQALPRSGSWLGTIKVILGFLELALAMKFLSNADLVWHSHILDREVYIGLWIVLFTLLGFYLLGKIRLAHDEPLPNIRVSQLLLAIASFWFVLFLIPGLWGAPLKVLSGILPPVNEDIGVKTIGYASNMSGAPKATNPICDQPRRYADKLSRDTPQGYCVFYDLEEGQAYAKKVHKPVFLDFTGHTCTNCRQVEASVWSDPRVKAALNNDFVMISLFTDDDAPLPHIEMLPDGTRLRTLGNKLQRYELDNYHFVAQPYYVILGDDGKSLVPARGFSLNVDEYLAFLQAGSSAYNVKI